jgi:5-formyltetrahydrofolate cyclo-ligase
VTDKQAAAEKQALRSRLRAARRAHVEGLDPRTRALLFRRPPAPLLDLIPANAVIGVYNAGRWEAPAASYAAFFHEAGHAVALPWFATREAPMQFRQWQVPRSTKISKPIPGASNSPRPCAGNDPDVLFVPLVGFTAQGARLGQGGGHYDRWFSANPGATAIGMGWDAQCVDALPTRPTTTPCAPWSRPRASTVHSDSPPRHGASRWASCCCWRDWRSMPG